MTAIQLFSEQSHFIVSFYSLHSRDLASKIHSWQQHTQWFWRSLSAHAVLLQLPVLLQELVINFLSPCLCRNQTAPKSTISKGVEQHQKKSNQITDTLMGIRMAIWAWRLKIRPHIGSSFLVMVPLGLCAKDRDYKAYHSVFKHHSRPHKNRK